MYLEYFNLKEQPFNISPDSRFMWFSEKHKEALASLKYGLMENKGFLLLTGDIGTGKTLLIKALIQITGVQALIATVPDPDLEIMDFFNLLADEFKMDKVFSSKGDFLIQFKRFLLDSYASEKSVLLIIDEAQRLNHELIEQIRMLSNIELDNRKLINIFFVGQSEFNQLISDDRNRAVRQRIGVNYHLKPLSMPETADYINHRLKIAGTSEEIFERAAAREVFNFSNGYPRLINVICDLAMVTGYSKGLKKIDAGVIKDCAQDLKSPIDMDKGQSELSNSGRIHRNRQQTARQTKQPGGFMYGFAFILFLFMAFVGYQIYGSLKGPSAERKSHDFTAQTNYQLLDEYRAAFKNEFDKEMMIAQEDSAEKDAVQPTEKNETVAETSAMIEEREKETAAEENSPKNDLVDRKSPDFVADQRSVVYFEHNSNELTQNAYQTLSKIIELTSRNSDSRITVEGFTDSHGDPVYNRQLSKFRADMVKNYLIGHGIAPANITSIGRGPENPIESNATFEGRAQNRRVEILVKMMR